eukprot:Gb_19888 [translate_table: standard]
MAFSSTMKVPAPIAIGIYTAFLQKDWKLRPSAYASHSEGALVLHYASILLANVCHRTELGNSFSGLMQVCKTLLLAYMSSVVFLNLKHMMLNQGILGPMRIFEGSTHFPLKGWQKAAVAVGSAFGALMNPGRADLIAALGETTGELAFQNLLDRMKRSPEGRVRMLNCSCNVLFKS